MSERTRAPGAGLTPDVRSGGSEGPFDPARYVRTLAKHRGVILLTLCMCLALGAAASLLTQPLFTARGTLQIDREAAKVLNPRDPTPLDNLAWGDEFFQTQYGLLRSRALAVRVAETLGLARDDAFLSQMKAPLPKAAAGEVATSRRQDQVVRILQAHLTIVPTRGSRLVAVNFSGPDPILAARIANAFADDFIAEGLDRRFQASSYARDFLERRLAEVKARLEDSERALTAYATQRRIIQLSSAGQPGGPESGQSLAAANLEAFVSALATARAERIRAEERWRQAQGQTGLGLPDILQSPTIQILSQEHAKLAADYQDKLSIYKEDYPDMRQLKARVDETDRQIAAEAETIRAALRAQYETALNSERAMSAEVEGLKAAVLDMRERTIRYTILQREVDTSRSLYDGLLQRYKEVGVENGVTADNVSIVDRAEVPDRPTRPKPALNMALAADAGIVLGVALAFGLETFDQAIRAPGDIEARLGRALLGVIPDQRSPEPRAALADVRSPLAEAYQSLRSALQFSTRDGFPRSLLITSARPGGGKSTTAFAIAQIMARLGCRVLLIDADLRRPSLHHLAGVANQCGLTNALTGAATLGEVVQPTSLAGLSVIPSGPLPPNPAELLAGARLRALLAEAGDRFEVLILDGPPVLDLADAPLIGAVVAGVLLVIEARRTTTPQAQAAIARLSVGAARILGAILTRVPMPPSAYGYGKDRQT